MQPCEERHVALSASSVGRTPDEAETKPSRAPTDHSALGPRLRGRVNLRTWGIPEMFFLEARTAKDLTKSVLNANIHKQTIHAEL